MNKKGIFLGYILDLWGWAIFISGILIWALIFTATGKSSAFNIGSVYTGDDVAMMSYLKTPVAEGNVLDKIYYAYRIDDKNELITAINTSVNHVYGRAKPVCWSLWYYEDDEKELFSQESCSETLELFDQEIIAPLPYNPDRKNLRVRLTIPGYK